MLHAKARKVVERQNSKCKNGREVFYIGGIVASVYAFENRVGKADWAEALLSAGEINDLDDYSAPVAA
jgi:preprotein translocase subunit YajC